MPEPQTFYFVNTGEGLLHSHHCPLTRGDWTWSLQAAVTCVQCMASQHRPQTWHKPKTWKPRPVPDGAPLCVPPPGYEHIFELRKDGRWLPWKGHRPAYAFVARAVDGFPAAIYIERPHERFDSPNYIVSRMASDFCCLLHGCSNGVIARRYKREDG